MSSNKILFDYHWDVNKYKANYDPEYWQLCKTFMLVHKTKYPEPKLAHLTEAFYQMGVYGSSYDAKTTRMVSALSVEVLDEFLETNPGIMRHPFKIVPVTEVIDITDDNTDKEEGSKPDDQSISPWTKPVDTHIIVNVLETRFLVQLFREMVLIYDIKNNSEMNDDKASILGESFSRSKYGPLHWVKTSTNNIICPLRMSLSWKQKVLAEAVGADENSLRIRMGQAILSKLSNFCHGIEAKLAYYRDGGDVFLFDQPRRNTIQYDNMFRVLQRSQFKGGMVEIRSYIDTLAKSDSFAEFVFGRDFGTNEKNQIIQYVIKSWNSKLTYRTISKVGAKNNYPTHICIFHNHTGDELKRWLLQSQGENLRYKVVLPLEHKQAGSCDSNVREVLKTTPFYQDEPSKTVYDNERKANEQKEKQRKEEEDKKRKEQEDRKRKEEADRKRKEEADRKRKEEADRKRKEEADRKRKEELDRKTREEVDRKRREDGDRKRKEEADKKRKEEEEKKRKEMDEKKRKETEEKKRKELEEKKKKEEVERKKHPNTAVKSQNEDDEESLEKVLDGFVLFYDAKKNSEIDKDDWFFALRESFKMSKFGQLEVQSENLRPMRMRCIFKWKNKILASAEGLTETQAKTAATLQLISKLEPFTYIIQAKEEYFCGGKVPPFIENPDPNKSHVYRVVRRQDLPSYYSIFQSIDEFINTKSYGEMIFGKDFTWELKNEIVVYIKAKGLDYRYFTVGEQKPWTHMAIYHTVSPEDLKSYLLSHGGENEKYKLIPPPNAEPVIFNKPAEVVNAKEKPVADSPPSAKTVNKRKQPEKETPAEESEGNKIQIKLKKFKLDKVEYPEDTGGDFPGLILWINIKKNSTLQRSMFCMLLDSFKMSKFGELLIEEDEETVWGRKEPLKKCVIKANRKVLAVGLGESKTEAKNAASLQVLRQLRKNCYTIQAKESYFKEGKATPYDFEPDPAKDSVYRLARRNKFKDRASIIKFVDVFAKSPCTHEVIFGDDFTIDEREAILLHSRQIKLEYRLIKAQSTARVLHTHIALYHQKPLPTLKAALIEAGGENDKYRLINPGAKIPSQNAQTDMLPETLENVPEKVSTKPPVLPSGPAKTPAKPANVTNNKVVSKTTGSTIPTVPITDRDSVNAKKKSQTSLYNNVALDANSKVNQPMLNAPMGSDTQTIYPQTVQYPEAPYGSQPQFVYGQQPHPDMPLSFGPQVQQPVAYVPDQSSVIPVQVDAAVQPTIEVQPTIQEQPTIKVQPVSAGILEKQEAVSNSVTKTPPKAQNQTDLREELSKKRQRESLNKISSDKKPSDFSTERKITNQNKDEGWTRKVFVNEATDSDGLKNRGKSPEDRRQGHVSRDRVRRRSEERFVRRMSSDRRREQSPRRDYQRIHSRELSRERYHRSTPVWTRDEREMASFRDKFELSDNRRYERPRSPPVRFRDLWDNIAEDLSYDIFMYKYIRQDSTTETDPISLLQATRSPIFNIDFDFIKQQVAVDEWQVYVEMVTSRSDIHPLVGEGCATTVDEAKLMAAYHAVSTVQKACRVIEPNYSYFAEGGVPEFIMRGSPKKTHIYEIIQNLDPDNPLDRYTVEVMIRMFMSSRLEDLFFLASDFSYFERMLVVEIANKNNLWWRLFGPRHPDASPDDIVSTQHVCVFKQKSALQLYEELIENNGSTEKYTLLDPLPRHLS